MLEKHMTNLLFLVFSTFSLDIPLQVTSKKGIVSNSCKTYNICILRSFFLHFSLTLALFCALRRRQYKVSSTYSALCRLANSACNLWLHAFVSLSLFKAVVCTTGGC